MNVGFGEVIEALRRSTVQVRTRGRSAGSGVIWSADGQIITNAHVVEGETSDAAEVELWNGRSVGGKIIRRDRRRDLALVQVEGVGLPNAVIGDASAMRPGEWVIAVGNPYGFIGAASTGVVHQASGSSFGLSEKFDMQPWLVSQVRLAPGNSGGPLANIRGQVIGINTMVSGSLAFAVPSNLVTAFLNATTSKQTGLGVVVRPVPVAGLANDAAQHVGFLILQVIPGSPADRASLLQGDLVLGAGGRTFQSLEDLEGAIVGSRGNIVTIQFRRGGSLNIRTVTAQIQPVSVRAA